MPAERKHEAKGPVRVLCDEIGFRFERGMESVPLFVGFVAQLVQAVSEGRRTAEMVAHLTGKPPSEGSAQVMQAVGTMLAEREPAAIIAAAAEVHRLADELNPEDAYPTDHIIDQLSSCASALRFGLEERPWRSRHAAEAAHQVWRQRYGIRLEDSSTPAWWKDWARQQLQLALITRARAACIGEQEMPGGESGA